MELNCPLGKKNPDDCENWDDEVGCILKQSRGVNDEKTN